MRPCPCCGKVVPDATAYRHDDLQSIMAEKNLEIARLKAELAEARKTIAHWATSDLKHTPHHREVEK